MARVYVLLALAMLCISVPGCHSIRGPTAVCTIVHSHDRHHLSDGVDPSLPQCQARLPDTAQVLLGSQAVEQWAAVTWETSLYATCLAVILWILSFVEVQRRYRLRMLGLRKELSGAKYQLRKAESDVQQAVRKQKETEQECAATYGECAQRVRAVLDYLQVRIIIHEQSRSYFVVLAIPAITNKGRIADSAALHLCRLQALLSSCRLVPRSCRMS